MKEEELFIPKTKHKALKITLAIVLIIGLAVGGYFLYQYKFNNPKTIINNLLDEAKADIEESLSNSFKDDIYRINGHIKIDANISEELSGITNILKNVEIQYNGETDLKNNISKYEIDAKYKNDNLIGIKTYNENNITYLLLNDIYDKYIKYDTTKEQEEIITSIPKIDLNPKDIKKLYDAILDSLKKEISELEIKKENTTITIDGKDIDVINNYIELQDKEVNNFIKSIINDLKDNKDFTETLKKITDSDVETLLNSLINDITGDSFQGIYKINFYTDKGLFKKKLISIRQTIAQQGESVTFIVDKISDDEIELSLSSTGIVYSLRVKHNNSTINIVLNENIMGMYMKVELNMNYEKIKEITKPDLSNSVNIEDISEEDMKNIEKKIEENENLKKLMDELNKSDEEEA